MTGLGPSLALLLASPAAALPAAVADAGDVEIIAGQGDRSDRMTIPVRIDEHGPFDFLIDTGSQRTVLSTDLASRLAIERTGQRRIISLTGTEMAETAMIDELGLGRRSFRGLSVLLFEARNIGADGIVGIDSLQRQRVLLDFQANTIAIGDAATLGGNGGFEIVVTARRRGGQLIMTDASIDGIRTDVVIDTGAEVSIGNRALQQALRQTDIVSRAALTSVTGEAGVAQMGYARKLDVDRVGITNLVIAYIDTPTFGALKLTRRPALMLGMRELRLFRRVAIDFAARKVLFDLPSGF